ncbi:MAG: patatin-like phospholipase family protein [Firmicutes bacterium]|nr:patatin-like phospholipase family protein [Bacillota bacterium]
MKRGLVLSGGGSLGAYQIGAWKALRELNITFDIVTGVSIGALNGAFFVTGKYDLAVQLWNTITAKQVMKNGMDMDVEETNIALHRDHISVLKHLRVYSKHLGADISPFIKLMNKYVDPIEVKNSPITFGVQTVALPYFTEKRIIIQQLPDDEVIDYLHASSAVWPIFPIHVIKGKRFMDGGIRDNLPIDFCFRLGATEAIVINLWYGINSHPRLTSLKNVTYVTPSWDLGSLMSFRRKVISHNMTLGYNDTMKALDRLSGFRYTFKLTDTKPETSELFLALLKCDYPRLFPTMKLILERHTGGLVNPQNYFLRAVEILAETVGVDHLPIYETSELIDISVDSLCATFDGPAIIGLLRKIKNGVSFTRVDDRKALCALKYIILHKEHIEEVSRISRPKPKLAMLYVLMALVYREREKRGY